MIFVDFMRKLQVLIAHNHSSIEIMHTLVPFYLLSREDTKYKFKFIDFKFINLINYKADLIILTRKYHHIDHNEEKNRELILDDIKKYRKNLIR